MEHTKLGEMTSIKVKKATRDRLSDFGKKSETYDDVLNKLMDAYKNRRRNE
jgi:hypothetical protein